MTQDIIRWIQQWYNDQCNGDWEHQYGIQIETLDNPGWKICIDLVETEFESTDFSAIKIERNEHDWTHCQVEEGQFTGACGPLNLVELLNIFRSWVEASAQ